MRGIFPTLLAFGVGAFVFWMVWHLIRKGGKARHAALADSDIDRTAHELIEEHGDAADGEVARLAAKCLAIGDFEGEVVWQRVAKAVAKLQSG